ncbi:MAG: hypothetical protein KDA62_20505 [Planctomycetales bacterium]|nr:hypothetical protein [Planctomycetales bacterium]
MALVAGTALLMAAIFLLFKAFAVRRIPLLPAIAVNYLVACAAGLLVAPPWSLPELPRLWWPAAGLGVVFIGMFFLTALSAERAEHAGRVWRSVAEDSNALRGLAGLASFDAARHGELGRGDDRAGLCRAAFGQGGSRGGRSVSSPSARAA